MLGIALLFSSRSNALSIDATIQVVATVQQNPTPIITLNWTAQAAATSFTIYRKAPAATDWGTAIATLSGTTFTYADTNVVAGTLYEYKISTLYDYSTGYITSGINVPATTNRGTILLIVDNTFSSTLATSLNTYIQDLEGEGWFVKTSYVSRTATVPAVKAVIQTAYNLSPGTTKAVVLIGHVPVPYSGDQAPDGHPNHLGAWPADVYYADMDGIWTDSTVNDTTASDSRNWNIPGDGKFDQINIPYNSGNANNYAELEIGRIDLSNLPSFTKTELQLLQDYFTRNHNYRTKLTTYVTRALIDDNFGAYAESAWWLAPLVGASNTATTLDYMTTLTANSYLWSYGNGGGSYTSLGGIGTTANFAVTPIYTVFTMLFGSYTGDWDTTDNFMRASLAAGAQTVVWAGRPNWFFHDMGMDATIGYSNRKVQNNLQPQLYQNGGYGAGGVYVELLGDPTLRNQVIAPPSNLTVGLNADNLAVLDWTASSETGIAGYNIYKIRSTGTPESSYIKLNSTPVITTNYSTCGDNINGNIKYVVRAVKFVTTPSGSYSLESTGAQHTLPNWQIPDITFTVSGYDLITSNYTWNSLMQYGYDYEYDWYYSDGTSYIGRNPPAKTFTTSGTHSVIYYAYKGCRHINAVTASFIFPQ